MTDSVAGSGAVVRGYSNLEFYPAFNALATGVGLEHLKGLTQLQVLTLEGTKLTDTGLGHLRGLIQLQVFDLRNTRIADAGLGHLKALNQLRELWLGGTRITDAGGLVEVSMRSVRRRGRKSNPTLRLNGGSTWPGHVRSC